MSTRSEVLRAKELKKDRELLKYRSMRESNEKMLARPDDDQIAKNKAIIKARREKAKASALAGTASKDINEYEIYLEAKMEQIANKVKQRNKDEQSN